MTQIEVGEEHSQDRIDPDRATLTHVDAGVGVVKDIAEEVTQPKCIRSIECIP